METSTTKSAFTTKRMVEIALITAVICILAPFAIPIPVSPVPISLTNLVIYISLFLFFPGMMHFSAISFICFSELQVCLYFPVLPVDLKNLPDRLADI